MNDPRLIGFSVLLALLWSGAALAWALRVARDRARRVSTLVMVGFALVLGPIAFSKNGDPPLRSGAAQPSPPIISLLLAEVRTNAVFDLSMPSNAVVHGPWLQRGASDDWFWFHSTNALFRAGTNEFRSVRVSSRGTLSFSDCSRLEPFHAVLGVLPEPNWTNEPSRVWHVPAADGGRLFTWEGVALDRVPATPVSFQAELRPDGSMVGRYDLPHPATNFAIAAFGETALSVRDAVTNAAMVCRANGVAVSETSLAEILRDATQFELIWRAAEGDPAADPDADGLTTRDEIRRYGTDPNRADTDGDGLSDAAEILLGSDPLDADEDNDGIPDGVSPTAWAASPLWAEVSGKTNLVLSLDADVPTGEAATLLLGNHAIPLRAARSWALCIPEGPVTSFELRTMNGAVATLSLSEPATGAPDPIHLDDPDGVFRVMPSVPMHSAPAHPPSPGGSGHLCVLDVRFADADTGEPAPDNECIHDETGVRRLTLQFSDPVHAGLTPTWSSPTTWDMPGCVQLSVSDQPGDTASETISFTSPRLVCGTRTLTASIHRCSGGQLVWCAACGMNHGATAPHACPHLDGCPSKTNAAASCTCPVPVIRANGTGTSLSELALLDFPSEAECCCSRPTLFTYARIVRMDQNLSFDMTETPDFWVDPQQCPDFATVYATAESGVRPSEIEYEIVRRRYDGNGSVTTNETAGSGTLRVWATTLTLEPITLVRENGRLVNPCGIGTNETAVFRMDVSPAAFPDAAIRWIADPVDRVRFVGGVDTGRRVEVEGVSAGDVTLTAYIDGYLGPPPLVRARVMPRTTVPVCAWIICDTNGVPAVEETVLRGKFPEINRIWDQAGITWQLAEVNFVTNQDWLVVSSGLNGNYETVCLFGSPNGGVELYCVVDTPGALGRTTLRGAVVKGSAPAFAYAHEFGHFCNLRDVYVSHSPDTGLIVTGDPESNRFSRDWPSDSEEGYYPSSLAQSNLIERLLMLGRASPSQADISAGDVYGLWNNRYVDQNSHHWVTNYVLGAAPVGFLDHGNKQPVGN